MQTLAPGITVNGIKISIDQINAEVQYHPAETLVDAKYDAMKALVIKEILIQRSVELGLCQRDHAIKKPDDAIESLLEQEITVPHADDATCERYYDNNKEKFFTSPLFEVSHILYLAPPEDGEVRKEAKLKAEDALTRINAKPELFAQIAREESGCSSAKEDGRLGQISKGQTMPGFEAALFQMYEGDLSKAPVATEVGYHIIKVHERAEGAQLPFQGVVEWIKGELHQKSWNKAFQQYVQILAGRAEISGFRFEGAKTPLVQ
jgi:peptidyl-prolyl cis-trans isomerase C